MGLGLIGTLELAKRGMDTNRQGIELTGHNLANISNPAYARQRLQIQTGDTLPGPTGPTGTGSKVASIEQIRDTLLDSQIVTEKSVTGFLETKQRSLEYAEVNLGQQIDRQSSTPEGMAAAAGIGGQFGIVEGLSEFFGALQALTTSPHSTADRQVVLLKGQNLTEKFNKVTERLERLVDDLNTFISDDVAAANQLLREIADLSQGVASSELSEGNANDLRDRRQNKIEALSAIVSFQSSTSGNDFQLVIGGTTFIDGNEVVDTLETYEDDNGNSLLKSDSGTNLTVTSGSIPGTIDARDEAIADLTSDLNLLAETLIDKINTLHAAGFALNGTSTGADFFTGTDATDIAVNATLLDDPTMIQASTNGESGNNGVALAMARLSGDTQSELGNLTFTEHYNQTVANLGQALANTTSQLQDQTAVNRMLERQRDSVGGVSIDEEMTNLLIFQRAFQASAKMLTTIDELLQSVMALTK